MAKTEINIYKVLCYAYKVVVGGVALIRSFAVGKGLNLFLYNSQVIRGIENVEIGIRNGVSKH